MLSPRPPKRTQKHRVKYPHIVAAAKAFGIRRESIWRAMEGQWDLPKLCARYRAFVAAVAAEESGKQESRKGAGK